jgi:transcriptional regulator with XRE-family HTH domain
MATVSSAPEGFTARQILAANLRHLRSVRGWSQEELAFECDLHRTFVAHVERCGRNISLDNLERLARALHVPVFELLVPRDEEKRVG